MAIDSYEPWWTHRRGPQEWTPGDSDTLRERLDKVRKEAQEMRDRMKEHSMNGPKEDKPLDPYASLARVFEKAMTQASSGKGKERHAKVDEPFEKQKICEIRHRVGSGYTLGQAIKKCIEAQRLPRDRAQAELLGAINYIAAEIICLEGTDEET